MRPLLDVDICEFLQNYGFIMTQILVERDSPESGDGLSMMEDLESRT
jgi:hypothetical protein